MRSIRRLLSVLFVIERRSPKVVDFVCPKCGGVLNISDNNVKKCGQNHCYDRSRRGYYNLLLGTGGIHGDNSEMVDARRRFLSYGHYDRLRRAICDTVLGVMPENGVLLDAGAGEGYYTSFVENALYERDNFSNVLAFDISKDAVAKLSSLNKRISSSVASSYKMPLSDQCCDVVMNVFSPLALSETLRVIKPGGHYIMVFPDEMHLFGLKAKLYDEPYKNRPEDTSIQGLCVISDVSLEYDIFLSTSDEINSLFMMTPYAYRTPPEKRRLLNELDSLKTQVAFRIVLYKKAERN